jgi:hypothetical protein
MAAFFLFQPHPLAPSPEVEGGGKGSEVKRKPIGSFVG